jgi:50S ribosomal subunit-associated GTPase HflX
MEKALLVGVGVKGARNMWPLDDSLAELAQLARTAGAEVVGTLTQRLDRPTAAYLLGKGKLEELTSLKSELGYDLVIFDEELSPAQQRNIEQVLQVKVIDRTALILDIFANRARTHEGRLQVELAQHEYLLPRLAGRWPHLERLGGGIGTRGPGETQLESDRRLSLPNEQEVLLTDTVGFIQKLPPTLVAAFRATLEELNEADLLLHVVDITQKNAAEQSQTVDDLLDDLNLGAKPRIIAINKIDLLTEDSEVIDRYSEQFGGDNEMVLISAAKGWGLERMLQLIADTLGKGKARYVSQEQLG